MSIFQSIAERRIREAMEQGEFDNLPGQGQPLVFEDDTWVPEDLRMAYRVLKNSGFVPPELELQKEIINLRDLLCTITDETQYLEKLRQLNYKIMCFNSMRKRPLRLDAYEDRLFNR